MSDRALKELLEYIVSKLVDRPDQMKVEAFDEDDGLVLELSVDSEDMGKVIGRQGRVAQALRQVMRAAGMRDDRRVVVEIV